MLEWNEDARGRNEATDTKTGYRFRIERAPREKWSLAIFRPGGRRSCDRSTHSDLAVAMAQAELRAQHEFELGALGRQELGGGSATPWGRAINSYAYDEGIVMHSTSETDVYEVSWDRNLEIPECLRLTDGWYQDDADGARITLAFPHLFTTLENEEAQRCAIEAFPDAYAEFLGLTGSVRP